MKKAFIVFLLYFILLAALGISVFAQKLTLDEAVSRALANNPEIRSLEREVSIADEQTVIARAAYLPQVSFSGVANHYFQRPVFFGFGDQSDASKISFGRFGGEDQLTAGFLFEQAIWSPTAFPSMRVAKLGKIQNSILLRQKQVSVVAEVKQTYLRLLIINERLRLKQQNIERNAKVLHDTRILLAQGKALRVDTLRAFTSLKNLEPDELRLRNELTTASLVLSALIGEESNRELVPGDTLSIPMPKQLPEEAEVYAIALENNPAIKHLTMIEELTHQLTKQALASRLPILSLTGQYFLQSQANNFEYGNAPFPGTSFVGLRLSVPVFSGFATQSRIQQASLREQQSSFAVEDARKKLKANVHELVSRYNESLQRINVAKDVNETARLTFEIVQFRYKNGVASRLEVTDSELALTQAQSNYLESIYDYLNTRINLLALMGRAD